VTTVDTTRDMAPDEEAQLHRWLTSPVLVQITDDNGADLSLARRGSGPLYELRSTWHQRHTSVDLSAPAMRHLGNALLAAAFLLDGETADSGFPASNMQTVV
jgi:hypothetical protein